MAGLLLRPSVPVGGHATRHRWQGHKRSTRGWRCRCRVEQQSQEGQQAPAAPAAASTQVREPDSQQQLEPEVPTRVTAGAPPKKRPAVLESSDVVATSLTRRFGLIGGLAWFGLLAVGTVGEQIKTRRELAAEEEGTKDVAEVKEVVTPEGLRYKDLKTGGGSKPQKGFIVVLDYKAFADGQLFEDTQARGKPIVFLYGARPFTGGLCEGVEKALAGMRAGGRRVVTIPPDLGFGASGTVLRPTEHVPEKAGVVPPNATLEYELQLRQVSIPPS